VKLDLDSTLIETYGLQKQGGSGFTYLNTRGYHPLAVIAETGEVDPDAPSRPGELHPRPLTE
jgi:hypothetical protein